MENIKRNIITFMKLNNWNQKQLAQKSGVTESYLSRLLSGDRYPKVGILQQIASAFGVSVSELMKEYEEPENSFEALKLVILQNRDKLTTHEQLQLVKLLTNAGGKK